MKPRHVVLSDSAKVEEDIRHTNMRMIYENPADYAAWRQRMGLAKLPDRPVDPMMRTRVSKLFRERSFDEMREDASKRFSNILAKLAK